MTLSLFTRPLIALVILLLPQQYAYGQSATIQKNYVLIKLVRKKDTPNGKTYKQAIVNKPDIDKLNTPLRALAAYYSGLKGSDCISDNDNNVTCTLTAALGLGIQGSSEQLALIKKWFPADKIAQHIIDDNCFVGIPGGSSFSDYSSLSFYVSHDTVVANYTVSYFSHGASREEKFKDTAIIKGSKIYFVRNKK